MGEGNWSCFRWLKATLRPWPWPAQPLRRRIEAVKDSMLSRLQVIFQSENMNSGMTVYDGVIPFGQNFPQNQGQDRHYAEQSLLKVIDQA